MKPLCRIVRSLAPTQDAGTFSSGIDNHVGSCLSCQAEMARYGRLRRQLASMSEVVVEAPEPLGAAVAVAISAGEPTDGDASGLAHPGRVAAGAGAVVAAAAGAAAVAVWRHSKPVVR